MIKPDQNPFADMDFEKTFEGFEQQFKQFAPSSELPKQDERSIEELRKRVHIMRENNIALRETLELTREMAEQVDHPKQVPQKKKKIGLGELLMYSWGAFVGVSLGIFGFSDKK